MKNRSKHNKKKKRKEGGKKKKTETHTVRIVGFATDGFPTFAKQQNGVCRFLFLAATVFFSFTLKSRFPLLLLLSLRCYDIFSTRARPSECYTTLSNVPAFLSLSPSFTFIHSLRVTLLFFFLPSLSLSLLFSFLWKAGENKTGTLKI